MAKLRCRRCLGRVDTTCNKFDNWLYVVKTGYRFTGLPVIILTILLF